MLRLIIALVALLGGTLAQANELQKLLVAADQQWLASAGRTRISHSEDPAGAQLALQLAQLRQLSRDLPIDDPQREKAERLLAFGEQALRQPGFVAASDLPVPLSVQRTDVRAGNACQQAIRLSSGEALRLPIGAGESLWFRIDMPQPRSLRISSRGSTIDAALSAWADCRTLSEAALASADDNFGLQAELAVTQGKQSFWFVRFDNRSPFAGEATISALPSAVVSGSVLRDEDSLPVSTHRVLAFKIESGSPFYAGEASIDPQGAYSLPLSGPGTFALRTTQSSFPAINVINEAFEDRSCPTSNSFDLLSCGQPGDSYTPIVLAEPDTRTVNFRLVSSPVLVGTVVSSLGGTPLAGAEISVRNAQGSTLASAVTDSAGRYRVEGLVPGTVFVIASGSEHAVEVFDNVPCDFTFNCQLNAATGVELVAQQTRRIDFELQRQQSVNVALTINGQQPPDNFFATLTLLNSNGGTVISGNAFGNSQVRLGPVAPGSYRLRVTSNLAFAQLYPSIPCASDCIIELSQGTEISVITGTASISLSMDLRGFPRLSGQVTESGSGAAVAGAELRLIAVSGFNTPNAVQTDALGNYRFPSVPPGSYLLQTSSNRHVNELYDDVPCERDNPQADCPGGQLLNFGLGSADRIIDVQLSRAGIIRGKVQLDFANIFSNSLYLHLLDPNGLAVRSFLIFPDSGGRYEVNDVPSGSFRVLATATDGTPQLFSMLDCPSATSGVFSGCALAVAQVINVSSGAAVENVDFRLRGLGSRAVRVISARTGLPLSGVAVDMWSSDFTRIDTRLTNASGLAYVALPRFSNPASVYVSTDNVLGLQDEVYDNRPCPAGSVFFGLCSLSGGTQVPMPVNGIIAPLIFSLTDPGAIFSDGFEP